jgi:predicted dienelactone hydrolase
VRFPTPLKLIGVPLAALLVACGAAPAGSPVQAEPVGDFAAAPTQAFGVGIHTLSLRRSPQRPLPTIIWYPAAGSPGADPSPDAPPAPGRFPVVLLSHGLGGQPEGFTDLAKVLAGAGFVVAVPAYPHTYKQAPAFDRDDVRHQPADAEFVLDSLTRDPFAGPFAAPRACAAGFSAGGFTTSGMLTAVRARGLRCGIVISAGAMEGGFTGVAAPVLFIHGDADRVVAYARGRSAFANLAWPKAFLTMEGQGHGEFLDARRGGFEPAAATIVDFLRWCLYGDAAARGRLPADGTLPGVAKIDLSL